MHELAINEAINSKSLAQLKNVFVKMLMCDLEELDNYFIKIINTFDIFNEPVVFIIHFYKFLHLTLLCASFDDYYSRIMNMYQSVLPEYKNNLNIFYTPILSSMKPTHYNKSDPIALFVYSHLCNVLLCSHDDAILERTLQYINANSSSSTVLDLASGLGYYSTAGPVRGVAGEIATYAKYKQTIADHYKKHFILGAHDNTRVPSNISLSFDRKKVIFFVMSPRAISSDMRVCRTFVDVCARLNYDVSICYPRAIPLDFTDTIEGCTYLNKTPTYESLSTIEPEYDYAFYCTHSEGLAVACSALHVGKKQYGLLGHMISTGLQLDGFISSARDVQSNYVEPLIKLGEFGCTLPDLINIPLNPRRFRKTSRQVLYFCPFTGQKMNKNMTQILLKIMNETRRQNKEPLFLVHFGNCADLYMADGLNNIYLRPYDIPSIVMFNDMDGYNDAINECDCALISFPYNNFVSMFDIYSARKPAIVLRGSPDTNTYAGHCGAHLHDYLELNMLVARDEEEYVQLAVEFAINEKKRTFISNYINPSKIQSFITRANEQLAKDFTSFMMSN